MYLFSLKYAKIGSNFLKISGYSSRNVRYPKYQDTDLLQLCTVPLWHPSLTGEDRLKIERIQKSACCIILGQEYQSYRRALKQLELDTLHERRNKLCKTFSIKAQKHKKFKKWFKSNEKTSCTRNIPTRFCEVYARTERFKQSPISYLTNILNNQWNNSESSTTLLQQWSIDMLDGRT